MAYSKADIFNVTFHAALIVLLFFSMLTTKPSLAS